MSEQPELWEEKPHVGEYCILELSALVCEDGVVPSKEFVASVKRFGVKEPIRVYETGDGRYVVVDGRRRVYAARQAGMETIAALIGTENEAQAATLTLMLNNQRSANALAEFRAIEGLLYQPGVSMQKIVEATGLPLATIAKRMRMSRLPMVILDALGEGKVAMRVADAMIRMSEADQMRLVDRYKANGTITMADVKQMKRVRTQLSVLAIPDEALEPVSRVEAEDDDESLLELTLAYLPDEVLQVLREQAVAEQGVDFRLVKLIDEERASRLVE